MLFNETPELMRRHWGVKHSITVPWLWDPSHFRRQPSNNSQRKCRAQTCTHARLARPRPLAPPRPPPLFVCLISRLSISLKACARDDWLTPPPCVFFNPCHHHASHDQAPPPSLSDHTATACTLHLGLATMYCILLTPSFLIGQHTRYPTDVSQPRDGKLPHFACVTYF